MISLAVDILKRGGLVAFATETVYGLGADATNAKAVAKIFAAKGRPATNPLIVHIANAGLARRYATHWPGWADDLAAHFWPGPLTLVLPRSKVICSLVTAGGSTVGIRVPDHPVALELLTAFDGPIAAPSANRANRISPTTAQDVRAELGDCIDLILDGGPCRVGIESTVLDLNSPVPTILRPGGISQLEIEAVIGPVRRFNGSVAADVAAASPGQHRRHYAPRTPAFSFEYAHWNESPVNPDAALIALSKSDSGLKHKVQMPDDPAAYAQQLYQTLRLLDSLNAPAIYIELPPQLPQWIAIRDRLLRATDRSL